MGVLAHRIGRDGTMNLKSILLENCPLPLDGDHGVAHWARVLENGLKLTEEAGADAGVVSHFAVRHDSRRFNEVTDPEYGPRAAEFAARLRSSEFNLADHEFRLLYRACEGHTCEHTHPDVTIQTCWDSRRLHPGRVGITPHPGKLCTNPVKTKTMIQWADRRASSQVVPTFALDEWGIDLEKERAW